MTKKIHWIESNKEFYLMFGDQGQGIKVVKNKTDGWCFISYDNCRFPIAEISTETYEQAICKAEEYFKKHYKEDKLIIITTQREPVKLGGIFTGD